MNRKFRLSVALDIDDLLMECVPYAIKLANEKYKFDPPLTIYEVDRSCSPEARMARFRWVTMALRRLTTRLTSSTSMG